MRTHSLTTFLFAGLLVACDGETLVNEPAAKIVVYGRVSAANGAVPRAFMSLAAHADGSCAGPLVDVVNAFTNASGDYRAALYSSTPFLAPTTAASETRPTVCVSVQALPAEESGFRVSFAQLTPVVMRSDALDSVRVDVELEPSP
jgi:hypothetical protein